MPPSGRDGRKTHQDAQSARHRRDAPCRSGRGLIAHSCRQSANGVAAWRGRPLLATAVNASAENRLVSLVVGASSHRRRLPVDANVRGARVLGHSPRVDEEKMRRLS